MVISTLELKKVLNIIMEKTKQLVKSEAWSLLLVDEKSNELIFEVATGDRTEKVKRFKLSMGEGIAGWVAQSGEPLLVPDVSRDPRFFENVDKSTEFKTKSILCVPLKSRGKILGVIEIINNNICFRTCKMQTNFFSNSSISTSYNNCLIVKRTHTIPPLRNLTICLMTIYLQHYKCSIFDLFFLQIHTMSF